MNNYRMRRLALLAALTIPSAAPLWAQQSEVEDHSGHLHGDDHIEHDLEEIVVRASPLNRDVVEISQSATVLRGESLRRELANNIGETLTRQAGLANASFGQNIGRPVIRGLQGQRVGVLTNTMSASDASAVSQDHAVSIEPFLADQIEILRGPATLLYGSGAIGGVVNIVSHTIPEAVPEDGIEGRAIARVDSAADQRFAAGRIDFGTAGFAFHADAFYRRTDDYEIPGPAELYPEEDHEEHDDPGDHGETTSGVLENSFLDNEGGALGASWIGDRWRLGLSWTTYDADYGIPGAHHQHHEDGDEHEAEHEGEHGEEDDLVTIGLESQRWDSEIVGLDPFAGFEQLKFRFANTQYTHTEFEGAETGTVFDSDTNDARLELRHLPWGDWSGAFGLHHTAVDFSAIGEEAFVPPSTNETSALFWIESADFGAWQLDLGLRYEDVEVTALETLSHGHAPENHDAAAVQAEHEGGPERRSYSPFSVSAGTIWHVDEDSHFSFNLTRAERSPTAQELFAFGPHVASQTFEIGDSSLRAESNLHGEIGYRVHGGRLSGSLVVYADRFDGYIYQDNTGEEEDGLPVRLWSQQDADFIGAELELRYDIGHFDSGHWWVFGLFDYVSGELDDGHNVPLMPPMRFGGGLEWHRGAWQADVTWIRADDHTDIADYETPTPGYDLVNATLNWRLPFFERSDWDLFLKGQNLLDEDIRNSTSYLKDQAPQIGRNFTLGLRLSF